MDNDGDKDALASYPNTGKISWYENIDAQGTFGLEQIIHQDGNEDIHKILTTDVDLDGDLDVLLLFGTNSRSLRWFKNHNGQGDFVSEQILLSGLPNEMDLVLVDVNGDGLDDVLFEQEVAGQATIS